MINKDEPDGPRIGEKRILDFHMRSSSETLQKEMQGFILHGDTLWTFVGGGEDGKAKKIKVVRDPKSNQALNVRNFVFERLNDENIFL